MYTTAFSFRACACLSSELFKQFSFSLQKIPLAFFINDFVTILLQIFNVAVYCSAITIYAEYINYAVKNIFLQKIVTICTCRL